MPRQTRTPDGIRAQKERSARMDQQEGRVANAKEEAEARARMFAMARKEGRVVDPEGRGRKKLAPPKPAPPEDEVTEHLEPQPHGGALLRKKDHSEEIAADARAREVAATHREAQAIRAQMEAEEISVENSVEMREGRNGGQLRSGNPGNRGGGRKSDDWRQFCAELERDPRARATLRRMIRGKRGDDVFLKAYRYVTEQAHGKATQPVQLGTDPRAPAEIIIRQE